MPITIIDPNRPIQLRDIMALASRLKKKLPDDYVAFLLVSNGGTPEANCHVAPQPVMEVEVDFFYGILDKYEHGDLNYMHDLMIDRVPENMVPIADTPCGDMLCVSVRAAGHGHVFYWDHEREANEGEPATFSNFIEIDCSFGQFLELLRQPGPLVLRQEKGFTGNRAVDARLANQAAGLDKKPKGFSWHQVEDGVTMQLVPTALHRAIRHSGRPVILNGE